MMVAIKELLSVLSLLLLLLLLFVSSVNSRGVKQFRSGECSLSKASHKKMKIGMFASLTQLVTDYKCGSGRRQDKCW